MRPLKLLAAGLVLGLALLAWLWTRRGSEGGPGARPATEPSARTELASPRAPTRNGLGTLPGEPVSAAQRSELGAPPIPADSCRIRVREATSHAPVPDAHVWVQREDVSFDSPAWWRTMQRFNDVEPVLRSGLGDELTLDAEATVVVPRPGRALVVAAASGTLHGEGRLEPDDAECVVELTPFHALAVEVVDREQRPVPGALVALYWGEFDPLAGDRTWTADEAGRVWIPKLEGQLWPEGYRGPVRVSLAAGVACEPEFRLFTTETAPDGLRGEAVRLVAGDFGRVVVQLVDAQGAELALEGRVSLDRMAEEIAEELVPGSLAARAGGDLDARLVEGRAVFASVGLGLGFDLCVTADGHDSIWREIRGPTRPGEELRVSVPIGTRWARARGRVAGIRASFGGGRSTWAILSGRPVEGDQASFQTSVQEDQPFERPIVRATGVEGLGEPWLLELTWAGHGRLRTTVVPRLDAADGLVDFGEVRFEPAPELARVRVVDPEGAALPTTVEIETSSGKRCEFTDDQGGLRLTGASTDLPLRVRASHREWLPSEWMEIAAPGSETTLVLRRGAALEGLALLPRGAPLDAFELELSLAPSASMPEGLGGKLVEGGRFRFAPCEPGRARLVVTHEDRVLVERDGLELVAGETMRLEPLDLAAVLEPIAVTIEIASGEAWSDGHLEAREPDGTLTNWTRIGPSARAALLAPRPSLDLWVVGRGARATLFEGVRDGDRLVLPAAPALRLRLPPGLARPEPPLTLVVLGEVAAGAELPFDTYDALDFQEATVEADGSAWLRPPWPGRYELFWSLRHEVTGALTDVPREKTQTVVVGEASAPAEVEAELTREELAAAVRAAGG
jgi:hypothetical protein